MSSEFPLVRSVASHSFITSTAMQSPMGKNIVLSCLKFSVAIDDFTQINCEYISDYVFNQMDSDIWISVNMLFELISIRSNNFRFDADNFSVLDAQLFIDWISTM